MVLVAAVVLPAILLQSPDAGILSFDAPTASKGRAVHAKTTPPARTAATPEQTHAAARRAAPAATTSGGTTGVAVHVSHAKTRHTRAAHAHGHVKRPAGVSHHAAKHRARHHTAHRTHAPKVHKPTAHKPKAHAHKKPRPHGKAKK